MDFLQENIRLRKAGVKMRDFYQRAEISQSTWTRWVAGRVTPRPKTVAKVNKALGEVLGALAPGGPAPGAKAPGAKAPGTPASGGSASGA